MYNQYETFDKRSISSKGKLKHNISIEALNDLKSIRRRRKEMYEINSGKGSIKMTPAATNKPIILPKAHREFTGNLYHSQNNANHLKSQSIDTKNDGVSSSTRNPYSLKSNRRGLIPNIWVEEKNNHLNR